MWPRPIFLHMISSRRLSQLNHKFSQFGETPIGPKYRWVWTADMPYFVKEGNAFQADWRATESGVLVPEHEYKRKTWADVYGKCWILAKWWEPMSQDDWLLLYGPAIPWPKQGEYQAIENVRIPDGKDPDDVYTAAAIWCLTRDLEKKYTDHLEEGEQLKAEQEKSTMSRISDELDDILPAFGKVPGTRGAGVSLPFTKFDK